MIGCTPHDETVKELLKESPEFRKEFLNTALEEVNEEGGKEALLNALRLIAEVEESERTETKVESPVFVALRVLKALGIGETINGNHLAHG